jgi:hypothetical protein
MARAELRAAEKNRVRVAAELGATPPGLSDSQSAALEQQRWLTQVLAQHAPPHYWSRNESNGRSEPAVRRIRKFIRGLGGRPFYRAGCVGR